MQFIFKKLKSFSARINQHHISEYAAECAYFTILSFIPFIIFFLTLVQYTNIEKETIYFIIKELIPATFHPIVLGIINEIYTKSIGTISIVAIIVALWSAGKGFFSLCKGLRKIYNVKIYKNNFFTRVEGTIYTLIFIIAIILFLLIIVLGNRIHNLIAIKFKAISIITFYILKFRMFFFIGIMFIVFLLIYQFIPKHEMNIKDQICGACFSSAAWYIVSYFFSIYINIFEGFTNTYGSLTSIILIMMWIYSCMYIILLGGEINTYFYKDQHKNSKR